MPKDLKNLEINYLEAKIKRTKLEIDSLEKRQERRGKSHQDFRYYQDAEKLADLKYSLAYNENKLEEKK